MNYKAVSSYQTRELSVWVLVIFISLNVPTYINNYTFTFTLIALVQYITHRFFKLYFQTIRLRYKYFYYQHQRFIIYSYIIRRLWKRSRFKICLIWCRHQVGARKKILFEQTFVLSLTALRAMLIFVQIILSGETGWRKSLRKSGKWYISW